MRTYVTGLLIIAVLAVGCSSDDAASPDAATPSTESSPSTSVAPATTTAASTTGAPVPTSVTPTTTAAPASAPSVAELVDSGRVLNVAHAGGDQAAPHSTMFAFAEAVAAGADLLEFDVQLTADDELIVQHDATVDKTTETTGPVLDLTLAEIQALDNAYWFSPECWPCQDRPVDEYIYRGVRTGDTPPPDGYSADDFRVITVRELAERFPTMALDIEIKGEEVEGVATDQAIKTAEALAAVLIDLERQDSVTVVSFSDAIVDVFHAAAPDVAVSPGLGRLTEWFLNGVALEPYFQIIQVPPFQAGVQVVSAESVTRAHDEGLIVWVWPDDASTQENQAFYETLIGYGVDGILAGRPAELALAVANATG